jgi:hypothetical protein
VHVLDFIKPIAAKMPAFEIQNREMFLRDTTLQIAWEAGKMRVGAGYAMQERQIVASPFMDFDDLSISNTNTTDPDVKYEHILVSSQEEFQQEISSSLKANATIFGIGLRATFDQLQDIQCNSRTMTSILRCTIDHEPTRFKSIPGMNSTAANILGQPNGSAEFKRIYGEYFISGFQESSTISAVITYKAASQQRLNEFKGGMEAGRGFASIESAAKYKDVAKNEDVQCTIKWQSSGIATHLLATDPSPKDIENVLKEYATCKPKKSVALLDHYSLIDNRVSRMAEADDLPGSIELTGATAKVETLQRKAEKCILVGAKSVKDQASEIGRTLGSLQLTSPESRRCLADQLACLWRLERRLAVMIEGERLIDSAKLSARDDSFRYDDLFYLKHSAYMFQPVA